MLIVCNGAFKSGSTWVFEIVKCLTGYVLPPERYLNARQTLPDWKKNPDGIVAAVNPKKLSELLISDIHHQENLLCKNHFRLPSQKNILLQNKECLVVDVRRDIRDATVSAYYHDKRAYLFSGDFKKYYWSLGRIRASQILAHYRLWSPVEGKIHVLDYQKLKNNFVDEVMTLAVFLGVTICKEDIVDIQQKTSIGSMRKKWNEQEKEKPFFRKGCTGDWQQHMDDRMLKDLEFLQGNSLTKYESAWPAIKALRYIPISLLIEKAMNKLHS